MSALPTVENPIINSAFDAPQFHWVIRKGQAPEKRPGRRDASYYFRVPEGAARGKAKKEKQRELFESDKPGVEVEIQVANQIRERLKRWQERGYAGATPITQELLALWQSEDRRERLFFAQREAAEAVIFLTEGPQDLLQGLTEQIPRDEPGPASKEKGYRAFVRYALKMATGTGKTTVMAMLAAWSILNRLYRSDDDRFTDTVLVICPNVTIRDRLRELDPLLGEQSLYATREIVPAHLLPDLRRGDVIVTNWHNLALQEMKSVNGVNAKVVKRGVPVVKTVTKTVDGEKIETQETQYLESDRAFVQRLLGNRRGRSPTLLVMNDEAHHAYRRGDVADEVVLDKEMADRNDREATVWIDGLDRINKVLGGKTARNGIRLCVDLSATPFYIQGSGNEVGKPYPWIVSDFGLLDAIEAGMVKIPMLPSADMTGDERPAYFNIWRWVQAQLLKEGNPAGEPAPHDILRFAAQPIRMLTQEWEATRQKWADEFAARRRRSPAPPVFIIVCRDTALAKEVHGWLADGNQGYGEAPECFRNRKGQVVTVRIDSKVSEEIESGSGSDEARRLRFVLETVGKSAWPGGKVPDEYAAIVAKNNAKAAEDDSDVPWIDPAIPPGRDVRCIISVAMLSEGWDATTVTHVIGLRPFGSQLLCEQVVGRALRRTHYDRDDGGLLIGEEASVLGVPFELIPFKISGTVGPVGEREVNHIFAMEEKAGFEITFPVVEGYDDPGYVGLEIDWNRVPNLELNPMTVPDSTLMRPMVTQDGKLLPFGPGGSQTLDLAAWRKGVREQQVTFQIAAQATKRWLEEHGAVVPAHSLFPQLLGYARTLLDSKVFPMGGRERVDLALNPYFTQAVDALCNALMPVSKERSEAEKARIPAGPSGVRSSAQVNFFTTRNVWGTVQKCHLNLSVMDTRLWEQSAAYCLDVHPAVAAWVKNDHLGLLIRYRKGGRPHNYIPDFIIRLVDGRFLIVEVKGELGDAELKKTGALRWCGGVNRDGRFGQWSYHLLKAPVDLMKLLDGMVSGTEIPFELSSESHAETAQSSFSKLAIKKIAAPKVAATAKNSAFSKAAAPAKKVAAKPQTQPRIKISHAASKKIETIAVTSTQSDEEITPVADEVFVPLHYATNRKLTGKSAPNQFYGAEREDRLRYGKLIVSMPRSHAMGEIERPTIWRLLVENPAKHVVLRQIEELDEVGFYKSLRSEVVRLEEKAAFIFIHGFNVTFAEAARRAAQMSYDLFLVREGPNIAAMSVVPILFSWPSEGAVISYLHDSNNVEASVGYLKKFLADVVARTGAVQVTIIAHSMGNRALAAALKEIGIAMHANAEPLVKEVVLAAPDIDQDVFKQAAVAVKRTAKRVTLYASGRDKALKVSKRLNGFARAGDATNGILVLKDIDSIDASAVGDDILAHSYIGETDLLVDLHSLMTNEDPPEKRFGILAVDTPPNRYWRIRQRK